MFGGIAGRGGNISYCSNEVSIVNSSGYDIGGISGSNADSINNCYNTGTIVGNRRVGGIAGNMSGTIEKCYNTGTIFTLENFGGGITGGENTGDSKPQLNKTYNLGTITKANGNESYTNYGGITGTNLSSGSGNEYLASTYQIGAGDSDYEGDGTSIKRIDDRNDLCATIRENCSGTYWKIDAGAELPTLDIIQQD